MLTSKILETVITKINPLLALYMLFLLGLATIPRCVSNNYDRKIMMVCDEIIVDGSKPVLDKEKLSLIGKTHCQVSR